MAVGGGVHMVLWTLDGSVSLSLFPSSDVMKDHERGGYEPHQYWMAADVKPQSILCIVCVVSIL